MTLWKRRISGQTNRASFTLNASIGFDQRMALQDVQGNLAWAEALELAGALRTISIGADSIQAAIDDAMMAADLADYLVGRSIPFREAHQLAG